jgi:hypothetical protein
MRQKKSTASSSFSGRKRVGGARSGGRARGAGELSRAVATRLIPLSGCRPFELRWGAAATRQTRGARGHGELGANTAGEGLMRGQGRAARRSGAAGIGRVHRPARGSRAAGDGRRGGRRQATQRSRARVRSGEGSRGRRGGARGQLGARVPPVMGDAAAETQVLTAME